MAKVSAVNKNDKRIKLSNRLYKKRQGLKKIIMNKNYHWKKDLKHSKNCQKCHGIPLKLEL